MAVQQSDLTNFETGESQRSFPPVEDIETLTGVRDLRDALEWYRNAHSRSDEGPPMSISGVWEVICGKPHGSIIADKDRIETIEEMESQLLSHREGFVSNNDAFTPKHVDRIIGLLRGLDDVDREYRVYGEDRDPTCSIDVRTRCYVGLYHVTDRTTIVTYLHKSQGMGASVYSVRGVEAPRMDVEEKLRSDVFYSKYEYELLDSTVPETDGESQ